MVDAIWFNQGQVCCAGSRLLVAEGVAESFTKLLKARMAHLRVGTPLDKSTDIGTIVHPSQLESIKALVARAWRRAPSSVRATAPEGCYYPPTLVTNVEPASILANRGDLRPGRHPA